CTGSQIPGNQLHERLRGAVRPAAGHTGTGEPNAHGPGTTTERAFSRGSNTMGNRLSKIYTRTGDDGSTGLADGNRIAKNAKRVEAKGMADELNCHIGVLIETLPADDSLIDTFRRIQHHLFDLGGEFAIPGSKVISDNHIEWLEQTLDEHNTDLPPLKNFILPGGCPAAA